MKSLYQICALLLLMTMITGILYPALVTGIGNIFLTKQSQGSLIKNGSAILGSSLIAQSFEQNQYFWPRPSASHYNAVPSGASNLGPTSAARAQAIKDRRALLKEKGMIDLAPKDLLTTSASGLDPHISSESAKVQVSRIISARGLNEDYKATINKLIDDQIEGKQLGFLGEKRVNVLLLNLELDRLLSNTR